MKCKPWGHGGDALSKRGRSWVLDFSYKRKRHKITLGPLPNRSAAREVAAKIRGDIIKEGHGIAARPAPSLLLTKAATMLVESARGEGRLKTADWYTGALKPVLRHLGAKRLSEISAFTLEGYKRARLAEVTQVRNGVKTSGARSVNAELSVLKRLYNVMIAWNKATTNPVKGIKRLREAEGSMRWLTEEEIARLLAACNPRLRPVVLTAIHSGCRHGELLSLTVGDINLVRRTLTVRAAFSKNGSSRSVPMNDSLTSALRPLILGRPPTAPLFESRAGTGYKSLRTAFLTACKRAGIVGCRFHDLRHSFASHLAMAGADSLTLQELGGWKSPNMVKRYAHLSQQHKQQAVDRLGEKLAVQVPPDFPPQAEQPAVVVAINR